MIEVCFKAKMPSSCTFGAYQTYTDAIREDAQFLHVSSIKIKSREGVSVWVIPNVPERGRLIRRARSRISKRKNFIKGEEVTVKILFYPTSRIDSFFHDEDRFDYALQVVLAKVTIFAVTY